MRIAAGCPQQWSSVSPSVLAMLCLWRRARLLRRNGCQDERGEMRRWLVICRQSHRSARPQAYSHRSVTADLNFNAILSYLSFLRRDVHQRRTEMSLYSASNLPYDLIGLIADQLYWMGEDDELTRRSLQINRHWRDGLSVSIVYTIPRCFVLENDDDLEIVSRFLATCSNSRRISSLHIIVKSATLLRHLPFGGNVIEDLCFTLEHDTRECLSLPPDMLVERKLVIRCRRGDEAKSVTKYSFDFSTISVDTLEMLESVYMVNTFPIMKTDGKFLMLETVQLHGDEEAVCSGVANLVSRSPRVEELIMWTNLAPDESRHEGRKTFVLPHPLPSLNRLDVKNIAVAVRSTPLPALRSLYVTDASIIVDYDNNFIPNLEDISLTLDKLRPDTELRLITDAESLASMTNADVVLIDYRNDSASVEDFGRTFNSGYFDYALPKLKCLNLLETRFIDIGSFSRFEFRHPSANVFPPRSMYGDY